MLELEVIDRTENPLLGRVQVSFRIRHDGAATPGRKEVRELLSKELKAAKEGIVLDRLRSEFGKGSSVGYAKLYPTKAAAQQLEPQHKLQRNGLEPPAPKKEAAPEAAPEAEAKAKK